MFTSRGFGTTCCHSVRIGAPMTRGPGKQGCSLVVSQKTCYGVRNICLPGCIHAVSVERVYRRRSAPCYINIPRWRQRDLLLNVYATPSTAHESLRQISARVFKDKPSLSLPPIESVKCIGHICNLLQKLNLLHHWFCPFNQNNVIVLGTWHFIFEK